MPRPRLPEQVRQLPKRYVLLELAYEQAGMSSPHQWDWSRLLGVPARPLAISQLGGLEDIKDALTHQ